MNAKLLVLPLLLLGLAFFIWACLRSAGVPGGGWLIPGGLAAWLLAGILDRLGA